MADIIPFKRVASAEEKPPTDFLTLSVAWNDDGWHSVAIDHTIHSVDFDQRKGREKLLDMVRKAFQAMCAQWRGPPVPAIEDDMPIAIIYVYPTARVSTWWVKDELATEDQHDWLRRRLLQAYSNIIGDEI